jgi:hypothetical protein
MVKDLQFDNNTLVMFYIFFRYNLLSLTDEPLFTNLTVEVFPLNYTLPEQ